MNNKKIRFFSRLKMIQYNNQLTKHLHFCKLTINREECFLFVYYLVAYSMILFSCDLGSDVVSAVGLPLHRIVVEGAVIFTF